MPPKDLGCQTNLDVVRSFVELKDRYVMDVGCGAMDFTRPLVEQGARVLAIDPDPIQAELNRKADAIDNLEFIESGADQLPAEANSVDGVFMAYSLHHIPEEIYPTVFQEVQRVLKSDGFLYVIEPTDSPFNEVMKLFHDEDAERAAAQQALRDIAAPLFHSVESVTYHSYTQYQSWDEFATRLASRSFNTLYTEADVRRPEVREAFERLGAPDYRFQAPKKVDVMKGLKADAPVN